MFTAFDRVKNTDDPGRLEGVSMGVTRFGITAALFALLALAGAACQTVGAPESMIRASHKGEAIPLLEGQAFSPGSPWGWAPLPPEMANRLLADQTFGWK